MRKIIRTAIATSSSGDLTLAAADANNDLYLLAIHVQAGGTTSVKVTDGTTDQTGAVPLAAGGQPLGLSHNPGGWARAAAGKPIVLNNSAAIAISGVAVIAVGAPENAF